MYLGQAAAEFERAICSEVLPKLYFMAIIKHATIKDFLNLINIDKQDPPYALDITQDE